MGGAEDDAAGSVGLFGVSVVDGCSGEQPDLGVAMLVVFGLHAVGEGRRLPQSC